MAKLSEKSKARSNQAPVAEEGSESLTVAQRIRQELEDDIVFGRLRLGERIDEVGLGQRYSVSRTPVREALNYLASSGLVTIKPHQGATVAELSLSKLVELFDVMAALEGFCVKLAARRVTPFEMKRIKESHEVCAQYAMAGDAMGFFEKNNELHNLLYEASGNETLIEMTKGLRRRVAPYRRYATFQGSRMQESVSEHAAIMGAIEARDGVLAEQLMAKHLSMLVLGFADLVAAIRKERSED
jgi:DNA-binding GntR family transcriptional regulator